MILIMDKIKILFAVRDLYESINILYFLLVMACE